MVIPDAYELASAPVEVVRWGEGHIHDTYLIRTEDHQPDYILQKINGNVFRNIPGMMQNIEAICRHLRGKLSGMPGHNPDREALTLVPTRQGKAWHVDEEGNSWRIYTFIPDTITYQKMTDPGLASEAGRIIGKFQAMLADLKEPLIDTIPDFHNISFRISQYFQAKGNDPQKRVPAIPGEIRFAEERFSAMRAYFENLKENAVVRATHNDTKVNNILFDRNDKALCLIDLDTVMPGYVHFDYGDALRTMANTALEDETDLETVHFNVPVYEAFTRGYLQAAGSFLSPQENDLLPFAPIYLTFMIGLRFLTDYLNGDVYFRIHYPEHNLVRARVQFKLVAEMEKML
jgi:hypothetical protein